MPEGYTHVRTARRAAAAVRYQPACPAAFAAGANGPDSLFCFEVWKKAEQRRYDLPALGGRMHEDATGQFLLSLADHAETPAQLDYLLGFLSHYAADTVLHPYVYAMTQGGMPYDGPGGHGYFEIALDSTLHAEDTGVAQVPVQDTSPELLGAPLAEVAVQLRAALLETYGLELPVEYLADAFCDLHRVRRLFCSRWHIKYALFWLIEPLFGERGFITGHITPRGMRLDLPDQWRNPFTGEKCTGNAFALLGRAQKRSELYLTAALAWRQGSLARAEFAKILGSMSYTTGTPTPQSDPQPCAQEHEMEKGE